jgi:cytoskeletal protein CcmA (bactofilin family)
MPTKLRSGEREELLKDAAHQERQGSRVVEEVQMARGEENSEVSVVGRGAKIEGTVIAAGSLKVEGEVKGTVSAKGDVSLSPEGRVEANIEARNITLAGHVKGDLAAEGDISLPANSRLEGNIRGQNIEVGGVIMGNIEATGRVQLGRQAHIEGDITAKSLAIEEGAVFSGRSVMGEKKLPSAEQFVAASSVVRPARPNAATDAGERTAGQSGNGVPQQSPEGTRLEGERD